VRNSTSLNSKNLLTYMRESGLLDKSNFLKVAEQNIVCHLSQANQIYTKLTSAYYDAQTDVIFGVFYNDTVIFNKTAVCAFRVSDLDPDFNRAIDSCSNKNNQLAQACLEFDGANQDCQCSSQMLDNSYTISLFKSLQIKPVTELLALNMKILDIYKMPIDGRDYLVVSTTHRKIIFIPLDSRPKSSAELYTIDLNEFANRK
jgi:hypothetical protein